MKNTLIIILVIVLAVLIGVAAYFYTKTMPAPATEQQAATTTPTESATTSEPAAMTEAQGATVIGKSVQGRDITAYHYGTGSTELLFVGGLHGGYEWNTSLVAYQLMDYLDQHPEAIAANESVTVIPVVNPDGLEKVTGKDGRFSATDVTATLAQSVPGRYNANQVDLNRNFDCDWQPTGVWQTTKVSGGTAAFSEPETQAIRTYIQAHPPTAVVVYYSAVGGVYSSNCHNGVLPDTATLTQTYAKASGYPAHESFDFYATTGDMVNWLAKLNIPAISVLLTNHTSTEWTKNQAGITAVLKHYAQ